LIVTPLDLFRRSPPDTTDSTPFPPVQSPSFSPPYRLRPSRDGKPRIRCGVLSFPVLFSPSPPYGSTFQTFMSPLPRGRQGVPPVPLPETESCLILADVLPTLNGRTFPAISLSPLIFNGFGSRCFFPPSRTHSVRLPPVMESFWCGQLSFFPSHGLLILISTFFSPLPSGQGTAFRRSRLNYGYRLEAAFYFFPCLIGTYRLLT